MASEKDQARVDGQPKSGRRPTAMDERAGSEHGPLPWGVVRWKDGQVFVVDECGVNVLNDVVAHHDNAEFIVRACNSHHELVSALKALVENYNLGEVGYEHIEAAEAVLTKAGR